MKKLFFKGCLFCLTLLISAVLSYAAVSDTVPKKINVQGKLTTDSGQPITGSGKTVSLYILDSSGVEKAKITDTNVTLDSDGLYSVNFDISNKGLDFVNQYSFKVEANGVMSNPIQPFATSPYSFHSSTATYALVLSPSGDKLVNENFNSSVIYKINVDSATSIYTPGPEGYVWGMKSSSEQGWLDTGKLSISSATTSYIGGLLLGNSTGLRMDSSGKLIVDVNSDTGLTIDSSNKVATKLASNKGLSVDANGLAVLVDGSTIEIDSTSGQLKTKGQQAALTAGNGINIDTSNNISAVVASNKGLSVDTNGLAVKLASNKGLSVDANGLATKLASNKGLSVDANGLAVLVDGSTIEIDSTSGQLKTKGQQAALTAGNGINIDTSNNIISAVVASNKGLSVDANGLAVKLASNKGLSVNSNGLAVKVDGSTIFINSDGELTTNSDGADLAEIYKSTEDLQPGDVVSIDTTKDNSIVKTRTADDTLVAGVISTEPGLLLNSAEKGYKLALVGKVPTKVCNEGGDIKRGDLLVSASIAGYAKKAGDNPKAGTVIGKALENFSSKRGTILVLVNLQ